MQLLEALLAFLFLAIILSSISLPLAFDPYAPVYQTALLEDMWRVHYLLKGSNYNYQLGQTPYYKFDKLAEGMASQSSLCFGTDVYSGIYCDKQSDSKVTLEKTYVDSNGNLKKTTLFIEN